MAEHAYATFVRGEADGRIAEISTLSVSAVLDEGLASSLRSGDPIGFFHGLSDLEGDDSLKLAFVDIAPGALSGDGISLELLLAAVLASPEVSQAQSAWLSSQKLSRFLC